LPRGSRRPSQHTRELNPELPISNTTLPADDSALCQSCGACCAYSKEWPRFSTEPEADLDRIPVALIDDSLGRMRCDGDRCMALVGQVGVATACSVYAVRPEVCRTCLPGDDACRMARLRHGLAPIAPR
jgi:Fe-S-cluster containining protein